MVIYTVGLLFIYAEQGTEEYLAAFKILTAK